MTGKELNENIRQTGFIALLLALAVLFMTKLSYFMSALLGAATLYMLLRKPYFYLVDRKKWKSLPAVLLLLTLVVLLILAFGAALFGTSFMQLKDFSPQVVMQTVHRFHGLLLQKTGYDIFSGPVMEKFIQLTSSLLPNIFNATGSVFSNLIMTIFILFFMLKGGKEMETVLERLVPLSPKSTRLLKSEAGNMVVSNAIGIPVIILSQAILAGLGYWMFGISNPIIWGALTGFFGIVPILGTAIIWLPLSVFLMLSGNLWPGVGLLIYSLVVITNIDNVIRIFFLSRYASVHPLITVFGIILGMNLFGFWGIIFGPLLLSGFLLLLKIYRSEFLE
jgi:predicted PurR-regulated permease PerM